MFKRRLNRIQVIVLLTALLATGYSKAAEPGNVKITAYPGMHGPSATAGSAMIAGLLQLDSDRVPSSQAGAAIPVTIRLDITRRGSFS